MRGEFKSTALQQRADGQWVERVKKQLLHPMVSHRVGAFGRPQAGRPRLEAIRKEISTTVCAALAKPRKSR